MKDSDEGLNPELQDILDNLGKELSDATIKSHCAITRDILEYLNDLSVDLQYNRSLPNWLFDDEVEKQIDRKFPVFLRLVVPHHYKSGEPTDVHYRTVWEFVFSDDYENSHTGMLDIPAEAFNLLPEVPEVVQVNEETYELWTEMDTDSITSNFISEVESLLKKEGEEEE
ncbi:MAG: hypothetical protein CL508_05240 [Actinobacteria bacterium]|nr:hypothetical protein [Actinomycetota bacterium]MBO71702.1 hypothetical protein [Actinomycetota bacterium]|tara:strand:+ start:25585 stop:26094 length:510 start_codon:yes stop_codon:yes gene_type:complete